MTEQCLFAILPLVCVMNTRKIVLFSFDTTLHKHTKDGFLIVRITCQCYQAEPNVCKSRNELLSYLTSQFKCHILVDKQLL